VVATGDYWFGEEALKLGLVDELKTSDDYLLQFDKELPIFELNYQVKQSFSDRLSGMMSKALGQSFFGALRWLETRRFL